MTLPTPAFHHLRALTDAGGLFEHALGTVARREHGYCLDDAARGLVVMSRETPSARHEDLRDQYLTFVLDAQVADGRFHNRRGTDLEWKDEPSTDDCWGRALWGLGTAVAAMGESDLRDRALGAFTLGARWRSPWPRATAFAALGAAEVSAVLPGQDETITLLAACAESIGAPAGCGSWAWPEPRLTYANAALPDALLAAGTALGDQPIIANALTMLRWLLELQTQDGHLSVVPVGGRGPADPAPGFDQQPIEVAALADACARAHRLTGDAIWADAVDLAASWFLGNNDSGCALGDPASGGGYDGLERHGRNENQGAESTLAWISTLQQARGLSRP